MAEPARINVSERDCETCGVDRFEIYHEALPEMRVAGPSRATAAERLIEQLSKNLDVVGDPAHRDPVLAAIADVQAFQAAEQAARPA